ncbi:MAG: hypothetical protein BGO69_15960 [Bacteroidetes bacterium 46-16]|nr:MAG: hypothetical protein BGO69_15960 [Bacteroidetes bacterium 46-16]
MAKKRHIGHFLSFKFTDRKEIIEGIVIDHNKDWTLLKYCPVDYVVDGFVIFRNKNIEGYRRANEERFKEKIMKLKGAMPVEDDIVPLYNIETILQYLNEKHKVFYIELTSERAMYPGRLRTIDTQKLVLDFLDTDGKWRGKVTFKPGNVRIIYFDNDYLNSLKLISGKK